MRIATFFNLAAFLSVLAVPVLTQPSPPSEGVQLSAAWDVRFPLTVSQCEPVLIYYDTTSVYALEIYVHVADDYFHDLLSLTIPIGVGYYEWICNIPAGYGFIVEGIYERYYVVQPGSSSSCLQDVTTIYTYAIYNTTAFYSYTANPPNTTSPIVILTATTVPIPAGTFSTITANPDLAIAITTSTPSSTTLFSPSTTPSVSLLSTPSPSHKSTTPAIVGGIIGGLAVMTIYAVFLARLWRRRKPNPHIADQSIVGSDSNKYPGPMTGIQAPMMVNQSLNGGFTSSASTLAFGDPGHRMSSYTRTSPSSVGTSYPPPTGASPNASMPGMQPLSAARPAQVSEIGAPDIVTALDTIGRMEPSQQRTLVSMLNSLVPPERPAGPGEGVVVRAPYTV